MIRNTIMLVGLCLMTSGCVSNHSVVCPKIKTYTKQQQLNLLNDINNSKISSTGLLFIEDYKTLRNEVKVCGDN